MTYLLKRKTGEKPALVEADALRVQYPAVTKQKRIVGISGLQFVEHEKTGRYDRQRLRLFPTRAIRANGLGYSTKPQAYCENTAKGLKTVLRKLRDSEAAEIETIDGEIEAAERRVAELRKLREEVVGEAWAKANVVRLNELDPKEGY